MDSVRIGKALGIGTRVVSRAVANALEQTATQKTNQIKAAAAHAEKIHAAVTQPSPRQTAQPSPANSAPQKRLRFGEAIWGPIAHTTGVVWLEVMGLLFALPALFFGQSLWHYRADVFLPPTNPLFQHYLFYIAGTGLFVYFCVSSFVRAERKSRRKR